jgi:modulator of FtsH protease HflC
MSRVSLFLLFAFTLLALNSAFFLDETELAIVTQFGEYKRSEKEPGLKFKKPFLEQVARMDRRVLSRDIRRDEYLTLDKKRLVADPITRWRIEDPLLFYKTVRDESQANLRLDDIVGSEMRRVISSRDFGEIIGHKREAMMQIVGDRVREKVSEYGIHTVDVRIKRADLPSEVQESVFQRMRAERERVAKKYRSEGKEEEQKIRAQTDKEVTILLATAYEISQRLRGEGDAEGTRIYADAYQRDPEFYAFLRSLESYEKTVDSKTRLVLSTEGELFQYLTREK